jgi:hypothetical protein
MFYFLTINTMLYIINNLRYIVEILELSSSIKKTNRNDQNIKVYKLFFLHEYNICFF